MVVCVYFSWSDCSEQGCDLSLSSYCSCIVFFVYINPLYLPLSMEHAFQHNTSHLGSKHFFGALHHCVCVRAKTFHKHVECHPLSIFIRFFYFLGSLSLNNAGSLCFVTAVWWRKPCAALVVRGRECEWRRACWMFYLCAVSAPSCSLIRVCSGINCL